jgi:hypothetical protein
MDASANIPKASTPTTGKFSSSKYSVPGVSFAEALQNTADQPQQQAHPLLVAYQNITKQPRALTPPKQQQTGQSLPAPNINSLPLDNIFRVVTVVQRMMPGLNGAVSEEEKILVMTITKIVTNLVKKLVSRVHRPLKAIAFNANGIGKQSHGLSKQLEDVCIDVDLFLMTRLKSHQRVFSPNLHIYRKDRCPDRKGGTAVAVRKDIPHSHVDLPLLV